MDVHEKNKKSSNIKNYTPQQKNKTGSKPISHTVVTKKSSPKGVKRKHHELENRKDEILTQLKFLKNKIDDIYDKFLNKISVEDWREELKFELKQENILEISDNFPKSLNTKGSHLLEYTKFWILFIELKFSNLDLLEIVGLFNNALQYDQNDIILLYEYMVNLFFDNFDKDEILIALEKINGKGNKHRVPAKAEEITSDHIKFLVNKPELFILAKTYVSKNNFSNGKACPSSVNKNNTSPVSSQTKQKFNPHTYSKSLIVNKDLENKSPISVFNVFEVSFNKKNQNDENLVISSNKNNFSSTKQIKNSNDISTQTEKLKNDFTIENQFFSVNPIILHLSSQEFLKIDQLNLNIKNSQNILDENEMKYSEIIKRNKFKLEISRSVDIKFNFISDVKNNLSDSSDIRKCLSNKELPQLNISNNIEEDENLSTIIDEEQNLKFSHKIENINKKQKTRKRGKSTKIKSLKK